MNTKTTVTIDWMKVAESLGWVVSMLAAVPYSAGDIANVFPPAWKGTIFFVFTTATVGIKVWRSVPQFPGNRPQGGAVGVDEIKPAALQDPDKCPACGRKSLKPKHKTK